MGLEFFQSIFNNIPSWLDAKTIVTSVGYALWFLGKQLWKRINKPKDPPTNPPTQTINHHHYHFHGPTTFNQNNQNEKQKES